MTLNQGKTWAELEHELGMVEPDLIFNDGIDYSYRAQLEALYGAQLRPMDAWTAALRLRWSTASTTRVC